MIDWTGFSWVEALLSFAIGFGVVLSFGLLTLGAVWLVHGLVTLVVRLAETINLWWPKRNDIPRKHINVETGNVVTPNEMRSMAGFPPVEWSKDGGTGFVVTEKPLPETKPKKFHRHMWRFHEKLRDLEYCFKCECGDMSAVPIGMFWGSPTIRSERALKLQERLYVNKKKFEKAIREGFLS